MLKLADHILYYDGLILNFFLYIEGQRELQFAAKYGSSWVVKDFIDVI